MKLRVEAGRWSLTVGFGWRYRFGVAVRSATSGTAGFGIGWARWLRRTPNTPRRVSLKVSRRTYFQDIVGSRQAAPSRESQA